ncbi:MAG TPA: hypothetical protein VI451_01665, partial [Anaerolineales bacterium]|nr:hypothetical protein [Anaerolineales bacterium]
PEPSARGLPTHNEIPSIKLPPQQPKVFSPAEMKPTSSIAIAPPSLPISKPITRPDAEPMFESSPANETKKKKPIGCIPVLFVIFLLVGGSALLSYLFYPNEVKDALAFFLSPSGAIPTPTAMIPTGPGVATATEPLNTPEPVTIQTEDTQVPVENTPTTLPSPSPAPTDTLAPTRAPTKAPTPAEESTLIPGPTPFGGSGQIVFASRNPSFPQLFIINADGTDLRQLTDIAAGACQPDWSPEDWIVFISPCSEEKDEYPGSNLWLIHADGSGLEQLTTSIHGDYDPDWSPDGTQIVFTSLRSGNAQIYLLTLADRSIEALTSVGIKNIHPSFSTDGTRLTFISTRNGPFQVWTMNSDGSEQKRLSRSGELKDLWPVFSLNGEDIIFTQRQASGFPRLVVVLVSGDGFGESILVDSQIPRRAAAVSPDGLWVVYETWPFGENHDIYRMTSEGEQITQVTTSPNFDFDPDWRPIP